MSGTMSSLEVGDAAAAAVAKTPNRVTLDSMKAKISSVEFIRPKSAPTTTIAVVILENGFSLIGTSASADAKNFDAEFGQKVAEENALSKMWPLEGYPLRQRLSETGE